MKIRVLSDLHLEFHADEGRSFVSSLAPYEEDLLLVAGDLSVQKKLHASIKFLCQRWKQVLLVPGNHEYYFSSFSDVQKTLALAQSQFPNFAYLDNGVKIIDGQRFVGSTLWFKRTLNTQMYKGMLNDFRVIRDFESWNYQRHEESRQFLSRKMEKDDIVISHHCPSRGSIAVGFRGSDMNDFYAQEMDNLILEKKPKLWLHGHTHTSFDYSIGATRILCNPFGYLGEDTNLMFKEKLIVEI